MKDYHINIFYSDEDECYIADLPDFQYCSAHGLSPAEALQELEIAKTAWLEVAREKGVPIPEPHYRPIVYFAGNSPFSNTNDSQL